ncbi:hypothetical protein KL905_002194 [Ogataea polymorpha]|nr:hypothetical protein KL927_002851 [Ogataea polymorpha]KAG7922172.1 hypothetical protein KL905_002194 [Ogataea polymorpha]KAG7936364.1 hypothetical protein KL934_001831 [Ogataea polymorpha]
MSLRTSLHIDGMTCSACTAAVEDCLRQIDGVEAVQVALITEEALVEHSHAVPASALQHAVEDIGFGARVIASEDAATEMRTSYITIGGMTCSSCVNAVTDALKKVDGVQAVQVSLLTEQATVTHTCEASRLCEAVEDCGFEANLLETKNEQAINDNESLALKIYGMTCSNCSNSIENAVMKLDGVVSCQVALATEEARIVYDTNRTGIRKIMEVIEDCGFDAILNSNLDSASQLDLLLKVRDVAYWRQTFLKMVAFGFPIFFRHHIWPLMAMILHVHWTPIVLYHGLFLETLLEFCLGSYIQFWLARRFYINSYKAIRHRNGTMDLLICVSTTTVYVYSTCSILNAIFHDSQKPASVMFDTSAMLFIFVSLGKWIESKAKGNTSTALSKLLSLTPSMCTILENPDDLNSPQKEISTDLLQKNDVVVLHPGGKVPADGECIYGSSEVDEALLTGESLPVVKRIGSKLYGGSINVASPLYMRVEVIGEKTHLSQIVKLVRDAQITKAPVQKFADVIAGKFVITILVLSLLTFIFWCVYIFCLPADKVPAYFVDSDTGNVVFSRILQIAISVVVVACPCALGLAAPTAVMVGTGVGATNGILIKGADILEKASGINCVVFDKTGTITTGKMRVSNYHFIGDMDEKLVWSIVHAIEHDSEHPVGKALVLGASARTSLLAVEVTKVHNIVGLGLEAQTRLDGQDYNVAIGNDQLMKERKIDNLADFLDCCTRLNNPHISTFSHILVNDKYIGYVELADTVKSDASGTVSALIDRGFAVAMVTGDNVQTARAVAQAVGIPLMNVFAQAQPDDKLRVVDQMQKHGLKVAFVGDGINDAPALIQADLGMTIATGTDIAIEAADVVLLSSVQPDDDDDGIALQEYGRKDGTAGILAALDISQRTFRSIKVNFVLAVVYNLIMLPIAMGLLIIPCGLTMNPMIASAAMACSSVSVVFNSLRLKSWKMPVLDNIRVAEERVEWADDQVLSSMDVEKMDVIDSKRTSWHSRLLSRFKSPYERLF